ncbi:META domain-containing protein [Candidatus Uabimicrobium amorphum]|uniref:DUF306 domain-containing protein n=1 Tax=Uabimicrobium amorphum TaxID=2596890 RepID=A0A5S9IP69_UABAM|nr:META domain-containing protein [Candidatus Uabimicrobium amorphum]BBM84911.1 hypothetical protein UABAM_03272 [Candidatus Uabimicrobium amorphum]
MRRITALLFVSLLFLGCQQTNEITKKVVGQPYWCLVEATKDGKQIPLKFKTGFSLYNTNNISGTFPVNGFRGEMYIAQDGAVKFGEVMWTSMAGSPEHMKEESALQQVLFEITKAEVKEQQLVMSNDSVTLKYAACDFGYMDNLRKNTWQLVGIEKQEPSDVVVAHSDPNTQYKNLQKKEDIKITLKCLLGNEYNSSTASIVYSISGKIGEKEYTAKLNVSKTTGRMSVSDVKGGEENEFTTYLKDLSNFSFMHDNLHIDTKNNVLLVFKKS